MRKIKLVKLNKEFNNGKYNKAIGTPLEYQQFYDLYKLHFCGQDACYFTEEDINKNTAGLFAIEYEPEGFEFRNYPIALPSKEKEIVNSELNRLADWCDGQSKEDDRYGIIGMMCGIELSHYGNEKYFYQGLKFNSCQSANLFITELSKPENSNYKKYLIQLLKNTRL